MDWNIKNLTNDLFRTSTNQPANFNFIQKKHNVNLSNNRRIDTMI